MKILIIDKDGVLNPEAFMPAISWGFLNISPIIMLRLLSDYLFLKKIRDTDMLHLEKFFESNKQFSKPSDDVVKCMIKLRIKYDFIILLTNNGTGEAAFKRINDEVKTYYAKDTFDQVIVQRVGQDKGHIYKKWQDTGHDVTVIDDSDRHIQVALKLGIKNVIRIRKKSPKDNNVFESLSAYVESIL